MTLTGWSFTSSNISNRLRPIVFCIAMLNAVAGCRHADSLTGPNDKQILKATLMGRVTDETGAPLRDVVITGYEQTKVTDANGLFAITNVAVNPERAFILAKKPGYFNSGRAITPSSGPNYLRLMMATNASAGTVDAMTGGTVSLTNGGSLTLPAGGVIDAHGAPYTGSVSVSAKVLRTDDPNFSKLFPGDLRGSGVDGKEVGLQSFGVMMAELHGSSGELLQPANGKLASFSVPIGDPANAPAAIPLWYFDESQGIWEEEGSAIKSGNSYIGAVQHFTSWNCDWKGPWGTIKGKILCNDIPMSGIAVNLNTSGLEPVTDDNGVFTAKVPAGTSNVAVSVRKSDNNDLYWTDGATPVNVPENATTDVGTFALASPCPNALVGFLQNCNGDPVDGMVVGAWSNNVNYTYSTGGKFQLTAPAGTQVMLSATGSTGDVAAPQTVLTSDVGSAITAPILTICNGTPLQNSTLAGNFTGRILSYSYDGSKLAALDANGLDIDLYDANKGTVVANIRNVFHGGVTPRWVKFSPDGSKLLTYESPDSTGGSARMDCWSISGAILAPNIGGSSGAFTADNSNVIAANGASAFEYDIAKRKVTKNFAIPTTPLEIAGVLPGTTQFIATSSFEGLTGKAFVWDLNTNSLVRSFTLLSKRGLDSILSESSTVLSYDGKILGIRAITLHFYDIASGSEISEMPIASSFNNSVCIDPDGKSFVAQYRVGPASVVGQYRLVDGSNIRSFAAPIDAGASTAVAISPDGSHVAALYSNSIRIWKIQ